MTLDEFKKKAEEWEKTNEECFQSNISWDKDIQKEWGFTVVEDFGGEGLGDTVRVVVHFPEDDLYFKSEGSYASYDGSDWSDADWEEVRPKEKTITVYE